MNMDLGLESLNSKESIVSFEELMVDILESEQQFSEEQAIFDSIDRLEFIRDYVSEHGISNTISAMIGDQISYSSAEELVEKIDVAIEGLLSKVTGDTLQNTLTVCKRATDQILNYTAWFERHSKTNVDENQTFKFIRVDDDRYARVNDLVLRASDCFKDSLFCISDGKNNDSIRTRIDKCQSDLEQLVKELNNWVRQAKVEDVPYDEYKAALEEFKGVANAYKTKIASLSWAKLFNPNATAGEIANKFFEHRAKQTGNSKAYNIASRNYNLNYHINVKLRAALRSIRIILTKGLALIMQNNRVLSKKD